MKKIILLSASAILLFTACQKDAANNETELSVQQEAVTNSDDQTRLQVDDDVFSDDAARAADSYPEFSVGTMDSSDDSTLIPGGVVERRHMRNARRFIIHYLGRNIDGIIKKGKVTVELIQGERWFQKGAVIKQTFDSCIITRGDKSLEFNGIRFITNVTGGTLHFGLQDSIVHRIRAVGKITYEDKTVAAWWAARLNTFIKSKGIMRSNGDSLVNGENCAMGGNSRFTKAFLLKSPVAITSQRTCGFARPIEGKRIFVSNNRNVTITYGVDEKGNIINSGCAFGFKVEWTKLDGSTGVTVRRY